MEAVIVATPSHRHKEIVLAALQAGKHVYCEAPLASSIEDARAIAQAAKAAIKLNFQTGLQLRSDARTNYILQQFHPGGCDGQTDLVPRAMAQEARAGGARRRTPIVRRKSTGGWARPLPAASWGKSASINWT